MNMDDKIEPLFSDRKNITKQELTSKRFRPLKINAINTNNNLIA